MADSEIMRRCNAKALQDGVRLPLILEMVKSARSKGLAVPVCLMGYCKPIFNYPLGEDQLLRDCKAAGVDGLIIVDYPPMYASLFSNTCRDKGFASPPEQQ
jgi:tryptophan synthase